MWAGLWGALFSALWRVLLFLASPRKSKQKEGDPRSVAPSGLPCATRAWRGRRKLGAAPLKHACPSSAKPCVARHLSWGKVNPPWLGDGSGVLHSFGTIVVSSFAAALRFRNAFPLPLEDAGQRRRAGGFQLAMFEPRSGEFSQPPGSRSSARYPAQRGVDHGVAFSLATFFWRSKRKYARAAARKPAHSAETSSNTINPT